MARFVEFETTLAEFDAADPFLLKNVRVLGLESRNAGGKRRYKIEALKAAIPLFENEGINLNHDYAAAERGRPRGYTERVGVLQRVRCDAGGLAGDVQLNPKHPLAEAIRWDYENGTKKVGLSWIGDGDCTPGTDEVFRIDKVFSIDVVQKPATSQSLREAEESPSDPRFGETENAMLLSHERRLGEHDAKFAERDAERAKSEAELRDTVKNLLAEVETLRGASGGKPKAVHIHPKLTPEQLDLEGFVASIQRKR